MVGSVGSGAISEMCEVHVTSGHGKLSLSSGDTPAIVSRENLDMLQSVSLGSRLRM